ncbi:conditioned medium-induced protein 4 [Halobellus rubicundus]|uniref:Conditioned medium-induced protein 4 n=1 Tax=Halobellus rubicundus TaxID=2996466 RepID=A0ABD5MBD0_9EURY
MDDKTAELRDLFVSTTGEETVTESQSDPRGSLSSADDATVDERLTELVEEMRERYDFASSLSTADLREVVRGFFEPEIDGAGPESWSRDADAALAASLDTDADADDIFRARMDLHLVAATDRDAPFPYERLRALVSRASDEGGVGTGADVDDVDLAESLAASEGVDSAPDAETVRRYRRVAAADLASRRASHRFRDAFAELLTDADLSTRLAEDAREDGLREATEDIETDVSL